MKKRKYGIPFLLTVILSSILISCGTQQSKYEPIIGKQANNEIDIIGKWKLGVNKDNMEGVVTILFNSDNTVVQTTTGTDFDEDYIEPGFYTLDKDGHITITNNSGTITGKLKETDILTLKYKFKNNEWENVFHRVLETTTNPLKNKFNIERKKIISIDINYWGDDFSKKSTNPEDIDRLVTSLNLLGMQERDNPNVDVRSGALAITLYDKEEREIDYFFFAQGWVYRGSNPYGTERKNIGYYTIDEQEYNIRAVCDKICKYPFSWAE